MSEFGSVIELNSLNGADGFLIEGEANNTKLGRSGASAGDINGDGYDDLILGANGASVNGDYSGAAYVVFGTASGTAASIDVSSLDGSNGFQINGEAAMDVAGISVASAGDVNGDGFDDLIIGASGTDVNGSSSGSFYVVFGSESSFSANLNLSELDSTDGFQINGETGGDSVGLSVASAGDVNGDGYDDLIVGAYGADVNGSKSGSTYVIFGSDDLSAGLNLSDLDGSNGFQINGEAEGDYAGRSVASAGDINGDGYDDLIIGAYGVDQNDNKAGAAYVVFGSGSAFSPDLGLATLDGLNGFKINGQNELNRTGFSVASAGDVNGDGYDDLIVGADWADPTGIAAVGASYVVFGSGNDFSAILEVTDLDGSNGFQINGVAENDTAGGSVASAGDVNGDGFDDIIIGADGADPNGSKSGAAYVVFGTASGFSASLELSALDGTNGFKLTGYAINDFAGYSVAAAGDVNGDGSDDILIGAFGNNANGFSNSGASYVVFGRAPIGAVSRMGSASADTIRGAAHNDTISGLDGNDKLLGGAGNDIIDGGAGHDRLFGADGADTLTGAAGNDSLYGGAAEDTITGGDGADTINCGDGNDTVSGGAGGDTVSGGNGADSIVGDAGNDRIDGGADHDSLFGADGADTLTGAAGNDNLYGGDGADTINCGDGNDTVRGGEGGDTVSGGNGADSIVGDDGNDRVNGGAGNDVITGGNGLDAINGGDGNDTLNGGANDDKITGGLGRDYLVGAQGKDVFIFTGLDELTRSHSTTDTIADFKRGQDRISLSSIDASTVLRTDDAFIFRGTAAFKKNSAGEVSYKQFDLAGKSNDYTLVYIDTDADSAAEGVIKVMGLYDFTASDFIL